MDLKENFTLLKELSKSGIVTLVLTSVLAGYLIGQSPEFSFSWKRMIFTLCGILFLASGSSALNQIQEKEIDAQMKRTSSRPLPSGRVSTKAALLFVVVSLALGLTILNQLSFSLFCLGTLAVVLYNGLYTLWWKKHWAYAAVPGALPGALPILMGHVSSSGELLHPAGFYLFFVLFFWQMPHFWVLALKYRSDYAQGGFPTLPVTYGMGVTVRQIIVWCLAYIGLAFIAPLFLRVSWIYFIPALLTSYKVLRELGSFVKSPESKNWLKFFLWVNFSLILFLGFAAIDLWSIHLPIPGYTR